MTRRLVPLLSIAGLCVSMFAFFPPALAGPVAYQLSVAKGGTGGGAVTSDNGWIDCGATCSASIPAGTDVTLTADPGPTSTFMGWHGGCSGTGACHVTMDADQNVTAKFARAFRPDAWVKLCGLSTGCTIDPLPHPWHGNNVYNKTGSKQKIAVRMEDGEGVRFWILLENDGAGDSDTLVVHGCKGTPRFVVNTVLVGKHTRPDWRAKNITKAFKNGTATFAFTPTSKKQRVFTLNMLAPTTAEGVTYRCPVTISSSGDPSMTDTIVVVMTTY